MVKNKKMKPLFGILLLCLCLSLCASADLLGSPQVRRELRLSHQVSLRIVSLLNEANRLNRGGLMIAEESRKLQEERTRASPESLRRQAFETLSPTQKQRLEQIELQRGGPLILEDWRFAQRIGVSREQHKKLQPVFNRAFQRYVREIRSLAKSGEGWLFRLDRKRYAAKYAAYDREFVRIGARRRKAVETAIDRTLSPAQKAKWRALLGKPFRARLTYDIKSYPMD